MEVVEEETSFRHFSHHHQLVRTNAIPAANITCFGCNLNIFSGKDYYRCKICPFNLHQACHDVPVKIRHPGHPIHCLNLLVMPASAKGSFRCKACRQNVTGFYYSCAECGICYHILCSALPLSVSIYSHSHSLKLEYSLPYDFECDLCQKPGYNGWLYRCRLCEFDTHLACAIGNQRAHLPSETTYSSSDSENTELRQLVSQEIARGNRKSTRPETFHVAAVAGWHQKLHSPKQKVSMRTGRIEDSGGQFQTKEDNSSCFSTNPGGNLDQSNIQSGELSTLLSYQFSDHSYFSIDIARSYSGFVIRNQERNEANHHDSKALQDLKQEISYSNDSMLDRITSNLETAKQSVEKPDLSMLFIHPENKLNKAFLITAKESKQINKAKETGSTGSSDKGRCSCWWKFLQSCY